MSDIRFNQWLHQSGTGGVSQVASGAVGVGTTNPLADFYVRGDAQITGILTAGHIAMGSSITFGDNDRAYFGDGTDLQVYHSGSHSYVVESGTGALIVNSNELVIKNAADNEDVAKFIQGNASTSGVELYFGNSKKFNTTNTGAVVTGILTATSFSGTASGNPTLTNGSNNRVVTATGANALTGETNLQWDGETLYINRSSNTVEGLSISNSNNSQGSAAAQLNLSGGDNSYANIRLECNGTSHHIRQDGNGHLKFYNNTTEKLRITSSGNVAIGTVTNDQRFRVYNGIGAHAYKTALFDSNSTHGTRLVITNSNNTSNRGLGIIVGGQYAGTDKAAFGWFNSDNTYVNHSLMTIESGGNIGINDTSPSYKLDVNGTGRFADDLTINTTKKITTNSSTGQLTIQGGPSYPGGSIKFAGGQSGATDRGTLLFYAGETTSLQERIRITSAGNLEPSSDNTYNFGSLTKRWANLYTADLNLSNEGSKNDVDGTWGQYTIQEGQDDLFLINNRSGKKYKFNLTEVS